MKIIEGVTLAPDACIAIVTARFNTFINKNLLHGANDVLKRIGQIADDNITLVWVPGAYELPLAVKVLANTKKYDAVIALGAIIRGSTPHFEYVAGVASSGIGSVSLNTEVPVSFGVLSTESIEQAIERSGTKFGNKGAEAAMSALEMINVIKAIKS